MKRFVTLILAAALALCVTSCSLARANSDVPDEGSLVGSTQQAAGESELQEPEIPEYDPIKLDCDNPLGDAEIESVILRLYAVGDLELSGADELAILDIIQNDARVFDDYFEDASSGVTMVGDSYVGPPTFTVKLASGEELVLKAFSGEGNADASLYIGDYRYELSHEEYDSFEAVFEDSREQLLDSLDETIAPYAGLTASDVEKVSRLTYTMYGTEEQELDDEQLEMLLEALNELELEPQTADFNLPILFGGSLYEFALYFKNGQHYNIGADTAYTNAGTEARLMGDSYPVVYIDNVIYRCNKDAANDIYWTFEELDPNYTPSYSFGRNLPDHRYENLTEEEILGMGVYVERNGKRVLLDVPIELRSEAAEVLRKLVVTDENRLPREGLSTLAEDTAATDVTIALDSIESITLGAHGDKVYLNFWYYEEDEDVIEALEDFIELAREKALEAVDAVGETQELTFYSDSIAFSSPKGENQHRSITFEIPAELVKHDDGYYADGYTFDTAPFAVVVNAYDPVLKTNPSTGNSSVQPPDDALSRILDARMEAAGGEGYTSEETNIKGYAFTITEHEDKASGTHEWLIVSGPTQYDVEIYVIDRGGSDITYDSIMTLLRASFARVY